LGGKSTQSSRTFLTDLERCATLQIISGVKQMFEILLGMFLVWWAILIIYAIYYMGDD
jgi:hypothetical protein